jgi:hypothetical protein
MPCVSRFYGIAIYLYSDDHDPPHFHARYSGQDVAVEIHSLEVLVGRIPARAMRLVREWAEQHAEELMENWNRARTGQLPIDIDPLP